MGTEAERLAGEIDRLRRRLEGLERAGQLARSTVQIGGQPVRVPEALEQGVNAGIVAEEVRADLEQAEQTLAALRTDLSNAQGELGGLRTDLAEAEQTLTQAQGDLATLRDDLAAAEQELGNAISASVDEYAVTDSMMTPPAADAEWSTDTPDWTPGEQYVWRRTRNTHIDGSVTHSAPAVITGADGTPGEDAVLLRVSSTRGTNFKNNAISTVLTVTVFKGARQITNITDLWAEFGSGAYLEWWWRRRDDSDFGVISSADPRLSQAGFALTVSPADVDEQTVFQCILHTS